MLKRIQYALHNSGTRFLSTENWNYSISWWINSVLKRVLAPTEFQKEWSILIFKATFRHRNSFLLSVAIDGKGWFETYAVPAKITKISWLLLPDEICLIFSSKLYRIIFCMLSAVNYAQKWPEIAISSWHSPFKAQGIIDQYLHGYRWAAEGLKPWPWPFVD